MSNLNQEFSMGSAGGSSMSFSSGSAGISSGISARGSNNIAADLLAMIGGSRSASGTGLSQIEQMILRATAPIDVSETEEITVIGQRGVWMNKAEVKAWKGDIAISEYKIHEDSNPQVINKKVELQVEYVQQLAIRYLRPPTPPAPGEIVISMESDKSAGPAPPLIIRQQLARADTPEPLVLREAPPQPPKPIGPKRITISGKRHLPPPRKVVIERLAQLPSKPQNIIVERWLPYGDVKRRVIFNKATEASAQVATPRNVIVQWEAPSVNIRKEVKYLGVIKANPAEYVRKYGASLKVHTSLPKFVLDIKTPSKIGVLAAEHKSKASLELEGQLEGFKYVNLDTEGLSEYRTFLASKGIRDLGAGSAGGASLSSASSDISSSSFASSGMSSLSGLYGMSSSSGSFGMSSSSSGSALSAAAAKIFSIVDSDNSGDISIEEAGSIVLRLNSQMNRSYGEVEVRAFFSLVSGGSKQISRAQFLAAFEKLAA